MPISAEQERILLNKYKLTTLCPVEWPYPDDEDSSEDDGEDHQPAYEGHHRRQTSKISVNARFRTIGRHASSPTTRMAPNEAGVQKDEPDALGMAPSIAAELRKRGLPVEENIALRNKFMLSSTSFSPTMYLSHVHQDATSDQLLRGLDHLTKSIEQKSASLKVLVESNFERFVRAKATIDTVYTEMRTQGIDPAPVAQMPANGATLQPNSRQVSRNQSHFRNTSGPFGSQSKSAPDKMKTALTKESEYGVQGIKMPLQEVAIKAEEVWGPAIGGREKEETLKSVANALEQHREIFTLAGTVVESIKKSDYEAVVDAYRKAKAYTEQVRKIALAAQANDSFVSNADVQQIIVTARMWHDVNHQVDVFKQEVWRRLKTFHIKRHAAATDGSDSELRMELLATLLQLGVDENPIWVWIHSHYLHLRDRLVRSFERSRLEIEIQRRRLAAAVETDNAVLAKHLRAASTLSGSLRFGKTTMTRDIDTPAVAAFWEKVQSSISSILSSQNGILAEVVGWYNNARDFIDQKSFPFGVSASRLTHVKLEPKHVDAIGDAALDLAAIIRKNIVSFFEDPPVEDLSDLYSPISPSDPIALGTVVKTTGLDLSNVPSSPNRADCWDEKFAFWPPGTNSLSGSHYSAELIAVVGNAMAQLASLSAIRQSSETEKMKTAMTTIRDRLITAVCSSWSADSEKCHVFETWARSPERRDLTLLPAHFEAWEEQVLLNVQKITYVPDAVTVKNGDGAVQIILPPSTKLLTVVRGIFTTSLYKSLTSMVQNAENATGSERSVGRQVDPDGVTVAARRGIDFEGSGELGTEAVDASDRNVRMLLTLSNLNHLRSEVIPQLISQFEAAFSVKLTEESNTIRDVLSQIDAGLFESYVVPTIENIKRMVEQGILSPDWEPAPPRPTDARPYVYEVLLLLVFVHAEVSSTTASAMTGQVLSYLLEQSSVALMSAFKKRERYTLGALMQATLDVEFMAQTLNNYTTDRAGEIQSQIYLALDERTDNEARARLQSELPEMRGILKKLREGTKGEFGCFRRERRGRR